MIPSFKQIAAKYGIHYFNEVPVVKGLNGIEYKMQHEEMLLITELMDNLSTLINGHQVLSLRSRTNKLEHLLSKKHKILSTTEVGSDWPKVYGQVTPITFDREARNLFQESEFILIKSCDAALYQSIQPYLLRSHKVLAFSNLKGMVQEGWKALNCKEINDCQVRFQNEVKYGWTFFEIKGKPESNNAPRKD